MLLAERRDLLHSHYFIGANQVKQYFISNIPTCPSTHRCRRQRCRRGYCCGRLRRRCFKLARFGFGDTIIKSFRCTKRVYRGFETTNTFGTSPTPDWVPTVLSTGNEENQQMNGQVQYRCVLHNTLAKLQIACRQRLTRFVAQVSPRSLSGKFYPSAGRVESNANYLCRFDMLLFV